MWSLLHVSSGNPHPFQRIVVAFTLCRISCTESGTSSHGKSRAMSTNTCACVSRRPSISVTAPRARMTCCCIYYRGTVWWNLCPRWTTGGYRDFWVFFCPFSKLKMEQNVLYYNRIRCGCLSKRRVNSTRANLVWETREWTFHGMNKSHFPLSTVKEEIFVLWKIFTKS